MFYKALLHLLPAVAYAQMYVRIEADNIKHRSITEMYEGSIEDVISDTERRTWNITDEPMKDMVQRCNTRGRPDFVYVRNFATLGPKLVPSVNVYQNFTHHVQEVHRIVKPWKHYLLDIKYEPVILATKQFFNYSNLTVEYNIGEMKRSVKETLSADWRNDGLLSISKVIRYEFILRKFNLPDFSITTTFGKNFETWKTARVVADTGLTMVLKPGHYGIANLIAYKGTMLLYGGYEVYLSGNMAATYDTHLQWENYLHYYDLQFLMKHCRQSKWNSIYSEVVMRVVFYSDAHIAVPKLRKEAPVHPNRFSNRINF